MKVYVVFDHDEMVISGVFDSEEKAQQYIKDSLADSLWQYVDVGEKSELSTGGWYQQFTFNQKANAKDGEVLFSLEECAVQ